MLPNEETSLVQEAETIAEWETMHKAYYSSGAIIYAVRIRGVPGPGINGLNPRKKTVAC